MNSYEWVENQKRWKNKYIVIQTISPLVVFLSPTFSAPFSRGRMHTIDSGCNPIPSLSAHRHRRVVRRW